MRAIGLEAEGPEPRIQHASHFAFSPPLRAGRTPPRGALAVMRRTAWLWRIRVVQIFALEGLPQALQFEDQRRALRPDALAFRSTGLAPRRSFIGVHGVEDFHDGTVSASEGRGSAFACGACGCGPAALPLALRTRANTSSRGPNAIALPS